MQDYIWNKGTRCDWAVTEFQVMCVVVGVASVMLLLLFMIIVFFAKRLHHLKNENKRLRRRRCVCDCKAREHVLGVTLFGVCGDRCDPISVLV